MNGRVKVFKSNFTQIPNGGLDKNLSLAASGLYSRILRLAAIPDIPLTKTVIKKNCSEKNKAFEAVWNELKEKGYLIQYLQPKASGRGWYQEYEIHEIPREDGIHTIYRNKNGVETGKTNLSRSLACDRYPPKGIYGNGIYRQGGNNRYNNISINTICNNIGGKDNAVSRNPFCNFPQNEHDFDKLEQEILENP